MIRRLLLWICGAVLILIVCSGIYIAYAVHQAFRLATIDVIDKFAIENGEAGLTNYVPRLVDKLHDQGKSYHDISETIVPILQLQDERQRAVAVTAMILLATQKK